MKRMRAATVEELAAVPGISTRLAAEIHDRLAVTAAPADSA